jgi:hypothetical protein
MSLVLTLLGHNGTPNLGPQFCFIADTEASNRPFKTIFILVELLNLAAGLADIADGRGNGGSS